MESCEFRGGGNLWNGDRGMPAVTESSSFEGPIKSAMSLGFVSWKRTVNARLLFSSLLSGEMQVQWHERGCGLLSACTVVIVPFQGGQYLLSAGLQFSRR